MSYANWIVMASVLAAPLATKAAKGDLQVGVMPMLAWTDATGSSNNMLGAALAVSYAPIWRYALDLRSECFSSRSRAASGSEEMGRYAVADRFTQRQCSIIAGVSHRLGYPSMPGSPSRFGLVIGLGVGYRVTTRYNRVLRVDRELRGAQRPNTSDWEPVLSSRIGVEYTPAATISSGLYAIGVSRALLQKSMNIEPALGLLVSGYFSI